MKKSIQNACVVTGVILICIQSAHATQPVAPTHLSLETFLARPPIHTSAETTSEPRGLTPTQVRAAYNLPSSGGTGTIAIISAYHHPAVESDLGTFTKKFNLPLCTKKNTCLEVHTLTPNVPQPNAGWDMETALDTQWAHAIAPQAKILVVESPDESGPNLIKAIDYARTRKDVVAISMSWGGPEFPTEIGLEKHFTADHPITFVAASGDDGTGASWPAASPSVIAVGGTSLSVDTGSNLQTATEKAWSGSGGGASVYETEPVYQSDYVIAHSNGKRAIPDVSYAADPLHGFSVYHSSSGQPKGWYVIGGTSAGAPQWAAISSLSASRNYALSLVELYTDKAGQNYQKYFRDILSGKNGSCVYYCSAHKHYDYVTGLGSPITYRF